MLPNEKPGSGKGQGTAPTPYCSQLVFFREYGPRGCCCRPTEKKASFSPSRKADHRLQVLHHHTCLKKFPCQTFQSSRLPCFLAQNPSSAGDAPRSQSLGSPLNVWDLHSTFGLIQVPQQFKVVALMPRRLQIYPCCRMLARCIW
jgi:hypothetical protein